MDSIRQQLQTLVQQSKQMNLLAQEDNWEQLDKIQQQQQQLLIHLGTQDFSNLPAAAGELLQQAQELNNETTKLAEQNKAKLVQENNVQQRADKMYKVLGNM